MVWVIGIGIFLILLFSFPRQMGAIIALILIIAGGTWLYFYSEQERADNEKKKISIEASALSGCLDPTYPISVKFFNGTNKTIENINFDLKAKYSGFSSDVYSNYQQSDKIIGPKETYYGCWSVSDFGIRQGTKATFNPKSLIWSAEISSVKFSE